MGVTAGIFLASILLKEMRYLVYIRYLCQERVPNACSICFPLCSNLCSIGVLVSYKVVLVSFQYFANIPKLYGKFSEKKNIPKHPTEQSTVNTCINLSHTVPSPCHIFLVVV